MRNTRLSTVSYLIDETPHTFEQNVARGCEYVAQAAALGCDIVCLPEMFRTINVPDGAFDAEGASRECSTAIADAARAGNINVIATYYVSDGGRVYNQATVFDRSGNVVGYYRKAQLTMSEVRGGVKAGNEFPVFDLDIGKIAVMICMDVYFPEIPRIYAHKGAEVLFWPTVMHGPTQAGLTAQLQAIALTNGLIVCESNMSQHPPYAPYEGRHWPGTARIIDSAGDVLAATGRRPGIAMCDVDLDEVRLTENCVLIRHPDHFREDLESITRLDLYAAEYAKLAAAHELNSEYRSSLDD